MVDENLPSATGPPGQQSPVPIILLAAGQGRRLGQCKPLAQVHGQTLLERSVLALRPLTSQLLVVLGYQALRVRLASHAQPHRWIVNGAWQEGQSGSLQAGLAGISGPAGGALICLVDQPAIPLQHYQELLRIVALTAGKQVVATQAGGRLMVPAYLPRALWPELFRLRGDQGARSILQRLGEPRALVCEAALDDLDTPADLVRHQGY